MKAAAIITAILILDIPEFPPLWLGRWHGTLQGASRRSKNHPPYSNPARRLCALAYEKPGFFRIGSVHVSR